MYYVIKQQHSTPMIHFIGFSVEKFIASKNNDTIIFEFKKDGKVERKWVKKEDIILLTQDKKFFHEIFAKFKKTQDEQQELVNAAKEQLEKSMHNMSEIMIGEIDSFNELKNENDIPCLIKEF